MDGPGVVQEQGSRPPLSSALSSGPTGSPASYNPYHSSWGSPALLSQFSNDFSETPTSLSRTDAGVPSAPVNIPSNNDHGYHYNNIELAPNHIPLSFLYPTTPTTLTGATLVSHTSAPYSVMGPQTAPPLIHFTQPNPAGDGGQNPSTNPMSPPLQRTNTFWHPGVGHSLGASPLMDGYRGLQHFMASNPSSGLSESDYLRSGPALPASTPLAPIHSNSALAQMKKPSDRDAYGGNSRQLPQFHSTSQSRRPSTVDSYTESITGSSSISRTDGQMQRHRKAKHSQHPIVPPRLDFNVQDETQQRVSTRTTQEPQKDQHSRNQPSSGLPSSSFSTQDTFSSSVSNQREFKFVTVNPGAKSKSSGKSVRKIDPSRRKSETQVSNHFPPTNDLRIRPYNPPIPNEERTQSDYNDAQQPEGSGQSNQVTSPSVRKGKGRARDIPREGGIDARQGELPPQMHGTSEHPSPTNAVENDPIGVEEEEPALPTWIGKLEIDCAELGTAFPRFTFLAYSEAPISTGELSDQVDLPHKITFNEFGVGPFHGLGIGSKILSRHRLKRFKLHGYDAHSIKQDNYWTQLWEVLKERRTGLSGTLAGLARTSTTLTCVLRADQGLSFSLMVYEQSADPGGSDLTVASSNPASLDVLPTQEALAVRRASNPSLPSTFSPGQKRKRSLSESDRQLQDGSMQVPKTPKQTQDFFDVASDFEGYLTLPDVLSSLTSSPDPDSSIELNHEALGGLGQDPNGRTPPLFRGLEPKPTDQSLNAFDPHLPTPLVRIDHSDDYTTYQL